MNKQLLVFLALLGVACAQQCTPDQYPCDNGRCIPGGWECDGDNDCGDNSDERHCPCDGFKCDNGGCVPERWVCDGDNDCGDYSDETDCDNCPGYECPVSKRCIPSRAICDGSDDCGDGSDESEEACPCSEDEWRCPKPPGSNIPGPCIPPEFVCDEDGIWDCPDGGDEANCTATVNKPRHQDGVVRLNKKVPKPFNIRNLAKIAEKRQKMEKKMAMLKN